MRRITKARANFKHIFLIGYITQHCAKPKLVFFYRVYSRGCGAFYITRSSIGFRASLPRCVGPSLVREKTLYKSVSSLFYFSLSYYVSLGERG
jgi:hypothetical protein